VYFDLRPFGNRQGEAMDSYLWYEADCPADGRFCGYAGQCSYLACKFAGVGCFSCSRRTPPLARRPLP
jgi:hypothetical protein